MSDVLDRLRAFQTDLLPYGELPTITIQGWGRGLTITVAEFAELLNAAQIGAGIDTLADAVRQARRDAHD